MDWIDLRSDTVTKPTAEMREAMASAEVGDDVYGEDPTVNELQDVAAEMLGKEAALYVPSGTMGNLAAVLAHCERGEEAILGHQAHQFIFEAGGMAALGGVHPRTVPNDEMGRLPLNEVEAAIRPADPHHPVTSLICYENTHNLRWGAVLPSAYDRDLRILADEYGLPIHLDGARIFNAAVARGQSPAEVAAAADSVTFCLSKGLCAPVGSVLCGSAGFIEKAHRVRKQLGGGMRQAGILAAAGLVALRQMVDRLAEDHRRAKVLAQNLGALPGVKVLNPTPASNMVYVEFPDFEPAQMQQLQAEALKAGIKLTTRTDRSMRLVTHYWIDDQALGRTLEFFETFAASA
ncbi:MAG: low-specificity L-threonine aldolase [Anaerolineales bacterium]